MEGDLEPVKSGIGHFISIHTLRVEGDGKLELGVRKILTISIHTLRVEGDVHMEEVDDSAIISIHTLRVEGDRAPPRLQGRPEDFNPHPPRGG